MSRLAAAGPRGVLAIPGTAIDFTNRDVTVTHPIANEAGRARSSNTRRVPPRSTRPTGCRGSPRCSAAGGPRAADLLATLKEWWEPLLAMAPHLRSGIGDRCLLRAGDYEIIIDFPNGDVREFAGEAYAFRFDIQRELVETVVAQRADRLERRVCFCRCRFRAWRAGAFNEFLYNFFKSLSPERMRRAEAEARQQLDPTRVISPVRNAHRRLHLRAAVPAPAGRSQRVRRDRRGRIGVHVARLEDSTSRPAAATPQRTAAADAQGRRRRTDSEDNTAPGAQGPEHPADKGSWDDLVGIEAASATNGKRLLDAWLAVIQFERARRLDLSILDAAAEVVETLHDPAPPASTRIARVAWATRSAISAGRSSS